MKILQIIQKPQLRGAEIFACQLAVELQHLGHDVSVLYLYEHSSFDLTYDLNYISLGGKIQNRFHDFSAYRRLSQLIKRENYDLVQANAGDTLKYAALSKKIFRWKTPLVFRNANKMSDFIRSSLHRRINAFFLNSVDYIISVSENCRQDIIRLYPPAASKSVTGTIGTFNFDETEPFLKTSNESVWINVGSFVPEKNHEFLIELFAQYYKLHQKGKLWLVGDGKLRKMLEKKVADLGLQNQINFFGYRKDVIALIKSADLMVMPSKIEGLPGVILEALSCGKPVVAASVGGIPEVIKNGENGYSFSNYDIRQYIDKIEEILENPSIYDAMSRRGRDLIHKQFLMPQIGQQFENIYNGILFKK